MKVRHPIPRSGKPIKRSTKPIPKVNARRQAKRKAGYRKMLSGKEYKAARAEAMERAGNRCEHETLYTGGPFYSGAVQIPIRCLQAQGLHAHHLRYPKSRPLEARDLKIVCEPHHEYLESLKMGKTRMY